MTRNDSFVVGTLVVLLALIAGLVSAPSILPATASVATPQPTSAPVVARPYREGVLGHPMSVSPLTAKTHVSRTMVKLGARDRAQLVVLAYESGFVRPGWLG